MWTPKDVISNVTPLYCILPIFNPPRYKSRAKLYRDTITHIRQSGAIPITIEAAFGHREFALEGHAPAGSLVHDGQPKNYGPPPVPPAASMPSSRAHQDYIKVRAGDNQEIWLKEALAMLAVQHLPPDAKYIAFVDTDIRFVRPDWVSETLHKLQQYKVVQMFSTAIDLSPTYEPLRLHRGFMWCYQHDLPASWTQPGAKGEAGMTYYGEAAIASKLPKGVNPWHPGFAWAWRRDALDLMGGLIDWAPLGAGDHHMALSLIGKGEFSVAGGLHPSYLKGVMDWQTRATKYINGNVGYVDGAMLHYWHGKKVDRKYEERWTILREHQFDPRSDLTRDSRGIYQLTEDKPRLRDDIRKYFAARNEDSIDVPDFESRLLGPVR
jgi:hypothetical protein